MASFTYPELNHARNSIRLLRILYKAGPSSSLISCKIYNVPLIRRPPYIAVSYVWGTEIATKEVSLNGASFFVRENVWRLLEEIRTHDTLKYRLFWVDAICINQADINERNDQVRIMREVYTIATDVLVWLGPPTDDSDLAMEYVAKQDPIAGGLSKAAEYLKEGYQRWNDLEGKAFLNLCSNGYWRWVWIVQEIMLGNRILVFSGASNFK